MRRGEVLTPLHDPAHRWVYFPRVGCARASTQHSVAHTAALILMRGADERRRMEPDEALLLKIHDSRRRAGLTRCGCHTAFRDPLAADARAHRESIEVRCLVVLPKEEAGEFVAQQGRDERRRGDISTTTKFTCMVDEDEEDDRRRRRCML